MSDDDFDERLRAIERALTDGAGDCTDLADAAALASRVEELEDRLDDLAERTDELDAATQALRGYVGNVRSVNRDVERRADAALAQVDRLEARIDATGDRAPEPPAASAGDVRPTDADHRSGADSRPASAANGDERARDAATERRCDRCGTVRASESDAPSDEGGGRRTDGGRGDRADPTRLAERAEERRREDGDADGGFLAGLRESL